MLCAAKGIHGYGLQTSAPSSVALEGIALAPAIRMPGTDGERMGLVSASTNFSLIRILGIRQATSVRPMSIMPIPGESGYAKDGRDGDPLMGSGSPRPCL